MSRFFITKDNIFQDKIIITGEDYNHIKNVLRSRVGDHLVLCDGESKDFHVTIDAFDTNKIITTILNKQENRTESFVNITLFQGIAKGDKMDFIIQKGVELGVKCIVPVITERTVVRFEKGKDEIKKKERWQKIAFEAAKQCNRGIIPLIGAPLYLDKALDIMYKFNLSLIPYEKEKCFTLKSVLSDLKNKGSDKDIIEIAVFIGPEGGFSEKEIEAGIKAGVVPVTLGPRILRTETASLATITIIMYELEIGDIPQQGIPAQQRCVPKP